MTAICGLVRFDSPDPGEGVVARMLAAQAAYGPSARSVERLGKAAFGRAFYALLPEDRHDRQPRVFGASRFLGVADARIDNREELIAALGMCSIEAGSISDGGLLLAAFERWQDEAFPRIFGAFAAAIWDSAAQRLVLARDALGEAPLHYHKGADFIAFASMPSGLHAVPGVKRAPDEEQVATFLLDQVEAGGRSFFEGIERVKTGHVLSATRSRTAARRYWSPTTRPSRLGSFEAYIEAFREAVDQAVAPRLRGSGGSVGAHLSSGIDSSTVSATAARLLGREGGTVTAYTSAPRIGYGGAVPRGRVADESPLAAQTSALYPNMRHVILRPSGGSVLRLLDDAAAYVQQPLGHPCNNLWWNAINDAAAGSGFRIMLTAQLGNLTLSAGGLGELAGRIRSGRWLSWAREARALAAGGTVTPRGIVASSFGPWVPRPIWRWTTARSLGTSGGFEPSDLLAPKWRRYFAGRAMEGFRDVRPPADPRGVRLMMLRSVDGANKRKAALARWGLAERDPTGDRRLVEFALALPPEMLLRDGVPRPLMRASLSDRLPEPILHSRLRGYQSADWHERFGRREAMEVLEQVQCDAVGRVIDLEALRRMIAAWPSSGWERLSVVNEYRMAVARALSAAHFLCYASSNGQAEGLR